jgi:predicted lipoprotein with Yx(FWY)xxD motif
MKTPVILLAAAAVGLGGYAAHSSAEQYGPGHGASMVTTATQQPYGAFLVDAEGRSLYILEGTRGTGGGRCSGECLRVWPPLHSGEPTRIGAGLDPAMLATVVAHGGSHLTYAGWPLFYYHHDRAPGDTTGQHVTDRWGTWHLLSPSGEPIRPSRRY